jgi:hypothetical protein
MGLTVRQVRACFQVLDNTISVSGHVAPWGEAPESWGKPDAGARLLDAYWTSDITICDMLLDC